MSQPTDSEIDNVFPKIPGSDLRRATCGFCKQLMRITDNRARVLHAVSELSWYGPELVPECTSCDGREPPSKADTITPRQRHHLGRACS
jgi:hypothetical protein